MPDILKRIKEQFQNLFGKLDRKRQIAVAGGVIALVILLTLTIFLTTRPDYVPLAQGLAVSEAAAVTEKLDELGVRWRDQQDATTILVPKEDLTRAKMALAVDGILGQKDFTWTEAFSNSTITTTSETKEKMFLIAQATALSSAIETLEGIESAVVNLYIPSDSAYFMNAENQSRASVILQLRSGVTLSERQVDGIVMILVNSVQGLEQENVSIIDNSGVQLNRVGAATEDVIASTQYELQIEVEERLTRQLMTFLSSIYGQNNVKVMPSVTLNFDTREVVSTVFEPPNEEDNEGLVRSISEITEEVNNQGAQGVPGTDSNGETTNYVEEAAGAGDYTSASRTLNYELNEINTRLVEAKGQVESLSIAVVVNETVLENSTLTEEHREELGQLIAASAGVDPGAVQVTAMAFADPLADYDVFGPDDTAGTVLGIPVGVLIMVAIGIVIAALAVFIVLRMRSKQRQKLLEEEEKQKELERELDEIQAKEADKNSPKYQIEKFIDSNPEAVARLMRAWMSED